MLIIIIIGQNLLEIFQNITGGRFFLGHSVVTDQTDRQKKLILMWPKQWTATSRITKRKQFAVCTAKRWDWTGV